MATYDIDEFTGLSIKYPLNPVTVESINGYAYFQELIGGFTKVTLQLINTTPTSVHPAHIHIHSAQIGGAILTPLNPVNGDTGKSVTFIPNLYSDEIILDTHINVHLSETDLNTLIAQGNVGQNVNFPVSETDYSKIRIVKIQPDTDEITLKNFGTESKNVADLRITSEFRVENEIGILPKLSGEWNLLPGAEITFEWLIDESADVSLYTPTGVFSDPNNMLDFVQYNSAGNGREAVAVAKGIWNQGDFLTAGPIYVYNGDGNQNGINYWN